jgi:hypothetical protein
MISNDYFFEILEQISFIKTDKYYTINNDSLKKMKLLGLYEEFTESLKPFYKPSKQFYLTRPPKYNNLTTLIRHVCKANNIIYSSKIKYDKSNYEIIYYIYKSS